MSAVGRVVAVVLLLVAAGCGGGEPSPDLSLPRDPASVAAGAPLYAANCARCHGTALDGGRGPALAIRVGLSDATLRTVIERGRMGMPAFAEVLTDDEIGSIIDYVRSVQLERRSEQP